MNRLIVDAGCKATELYEYYPRIAVTGQPLPSFDIGKKHFGVFVHDEATQRCLYAGLWKLGDKMELKTQARLTALLNRLEPFFLSAKVVLVERQRSQNYMAVRLEQHVLSYLELRYPHAVAVSVASDIKYRRLNGPLGDEKSKRKKWAITTSCELLTPHDPHAVHFIQELERLRLSERERELKADDVADAYVQMVAWKKTLTPSLRRKYML